LSLFLKSTMWSVLLSCIGLLVALYALCLWIIPAVVQYSGCLALLWHDVIVEKSLDTRLLKAVQDRAIRGNPKSVISVIDHYCRNQEWAMNVGDEKGFILDSVVSELNPQTVLELGTYCGYSAVRIGRLLHSGARLLTLEFNPDYAAVAREVISWVQLVEGASGDWIPRLREHFGIHTFDFIFLDHWKEGYLADIKLLEASPERSSGLSGICAQKSLIRQPVL
uniref:catechol O-methyltransferase n=1 Tax=Pygocentrus nattereri TaxID=42514 RepID=A0AAR2JQP1_PYGNA